MCYRFQPPNAYLTPRGGAVLPRRRLLAGDSSGGHQEDMLMSRDSHAIY